MTILAFSAIIEFFAIIYWSEILRFHYHVHAFKEKKKSLAFLYPNPASSIVPILTKHRESHNNHFDQMNEFYMFSQSLE